MEVPDWLLHNEKRDFSSSAVKPTDAGDKRPAMNWFRYSRVQREFESKTKYLRDQRQALGAAALTRHGVDVNREQARLASVNSASVDLAEFLDYLHVKYEVAAKVRGVYEQPEYRRHRFTGFRYRKRSEDRMVNNFKEKFGGPETTMVFYGDWSARYHGHGRGTPPTPTLGMCRLLARHGYTIVWVEEQYTSKHCHGCEKGELSPFRQVQHPKPGHEGEMRECWGLTRCDHCGRLWNRDRNAALNILWTAVQVRAFWAPLVDCH